MLRVLGLYFFFSCVFFISFSGVLKVGESYGFDELVLVVFFLSVNLRIGLLFNTGFISILGVNGVISDVR